MATRPARRPGRPPDSNSAETRQRILDVARVAFAEFGYGVTTNLLVATKAGITTGALYHYFDSKLDIYLAVHRQVDDLVFERLHAEMVRADTFAGQIRAVFDESHRINLEDPSIAQFLGAARVDQGRYDELRETFRGLRSRSPGLLSLMIDRGIATGEIEAGDRRYMTALLRTVFVGLVDAVSSRPAEQRQAMDGVMGLIEGTLVRRPRRQRARA